MIAKIPALFMAIVFYLLGVSVVLKASNLKIKIVEVSTSIKLKDDLLKTIVNLNETPLIKYKNLRKQVNNEINLGRIAH